MLKRYRWLNQFYLVQPSTILTKHISIQCFISPYKEDIEQAIYNM